MMQACCCGVPLPSPGPAGAITGLIVWGPKDTPADLSVYAIDQYSPAESTQYVVTHVPAGTASYSLQVPPGIYYVVARLDRDPLSVGGHTFHVCCAEAANNNLSPVRVDSTAVVGGIDVGDWGLAQPPGLMWDVDLYGSPASLVPHYAPSPKPLATRSFPPASNDPTQTFSRSSMGLTAFFPATWRQVTLPGDTGPYGNAVYFSNEVVASPLSLDSSGVWVTARVIYQSGCPFPDWRYATAKATVKMQGGSNHFFFEDPQPRDGPQPFAGYSVRGGDFVFGDCAEFIMMATTQQALGDNLPAFAAVVETAEFLMPCAGCPTPTP